MTPDETAAAERGPFIKEVMRLRRLTENYRKPDEIARFAEEARMIRFIVYPLVGRRFSSSR
jgi:hypothetical protein